MRKMENMEKAPLRRAVDNACGFVSVKIESTIHAVSGASAGKNTPNVARYLAGCWKTIRAATGVDSRAALTTTNEGGSHGY